MVRQIHLVLAGVPLYATRDGLLASNPSAGIRLPTPIRREHGDLTLQQVWAPAIECGVQADVVLFLAYMGLRWGRWPA